MQLFSADAVFKITPKTWKNCPQKLLIIGNQLFLSTGPAAQTAQKQKSHTTKSPLMQDWVFRLGVKTKYTSRKGERDLMSNRRLCWVGRVKYDEVGYLVD